MQSNFFPFQEVCLFCKLQCEQDSFLLQGEICPMYVMNERVCMCVCVRVCAYMRVHACICSEVFVKAKQEQLERSVKKALQFGVLLSLQVCMHIVQAIRKEASRVREEWESLLCSAAQTAPSGGSSSSSHSVDTPKSADTYCFEMLLMVLALSGSSVGRTYLSHQYGLLRDLLSLLHTGSARVQRQVS